MRGASSPDAGKPLRPPVLFSYKGLLRRLPSQRERAEVLDTKVASTASIVNFPCRARGSGAAWLDGWLRLSTKNAKTSHAWLETQSFHLKGKLFLALPSQGMFCKTQQFLAFSALSSLHAVSRATSPAPCFAKFSFSSCLLHPPVRPCWPVRRRPARGGPGARPSRHPPQPSRHGDPSRSRRSQA